MPLHSGTIHIVDPVYYKSRRQYTVRQVGTIADSISVRLNVRWRTDKYCYPKDPITGQWDRSKPLEFISYEVGQEEDITWIFHQSYQPGLGVYPSQIAVLPLMDYRNENGRPVMIREQAWFGKQRILHDSNWNRTVVEMEESGWLETAIRDQSNPKRFNPNGGINEGFLHSNYAVGLGNILYDEILQLPPMLSRRLVAHSRGEESYGQFSSESYITSRADPAAAPQVALYPNPTRDVLRLANLPAGARLTIADPLGRVVRQQAAATSIDVSDLPAGLWFLRVEGGNAPQVLRFIKE